MWGFLWILNLFTILSDLWKKGFFQRKNNIHENSRNQQSKLKWWWQLRKASNFPWNPYFLLRFTESTFLNFFHFMTLLFVILELNNERKLSFDFIEESHKNIILTCVFELENIFHYKQKEKSNRTSSKSWCLSNSCFVSMHQLPLNRFYPNIKIDVTESSKKYFLRVILLLLCQYYLKTNLSVTDWSKKCFEQDPLHLLNECYFYLTHCG